MTHWPSLFLQDVKLTLREDTYCCFYWSWLVWSSIHMSIVPINLAAGIQNTVYTNAKSKYFIEYNWLLRDADVAIKSVLYVWASIGWKKTRDGKLDPSNMISANPNEYNVTRLTSDTTPFLNWVTHGNTLLWWNNREWQTMFDAV